MTTLTADSGTLSGYFQTGNIPHIKTMSASDQRLGSTQPLFYQTGRRGERVNVALVKTTITQAEALAERIILEDMQGQKITVVTSHDETIEVFCHAMTAEVKAGAGKSLISASMDCEAMPTTINLWTTP